MKKDTLILIGNGINKAINDDAKDEFDLKTGMKQAWPSLENDELRNILKLLIGKEVPESEEDLSTIQEQMFCIINIQKNYNFLCNMIQKK